MSSVRVPNLNSIMNAYTPTFLVHPPILRNTEAGCIASVNLGFSNLAKNVDEQTLQIKIVAAYIVQLSQAGVVAWMFQEALSPESAHFDLFAKEIERLAPGVLDIDVMKKSYKVTGDTMTGTSCLLEKRVLGFDHQKQSHGRIGETTRLDVYTLSLLDGTNREFNIVNMNGDPSRQEKTLENIFKAILLNYMICGDWNIDADRHLLPQYLESCGSSVARHSQKTLDGFYDAASLHLKRQTTYKNEDIFHCFQSDKMLQKKKFIANLKNYWSANLLGNHQRQRNSELADKIAEKAWQQYLYVCRMLEEKHYSFNQVREAKRGLDVFKLEAVNQLNIHSWIFDIRVNWSKRDLEQFSKSHFPSHLLKTIIDLPRYNWCAKTESEEAFIGGRSQLIAHVGYSESTQVAALIELGADVNQYCAKEGCTALLLAISKGWNHLNSDTMNSPSIRRARTFSEFYPQKEIIKTLILNNADINAIHLANGMTPLHVACLRGDDISLIQLLLDNGANINAVDYEGNTPRDMLFMGYAKVQRIIYELTVELYDRQALEHGHGVLSQCLGAAGLPRNRSELATLPLDNERAGNIERIKSLLDQAKKNHLRR